MSIKNISIITPCFNEQENIVEIYERVTKVMSTLAYNYEYIFIDNASSDDTLKKLTEISKNDKKVKIIQNESNFGQTRSPLHAITQSTGDACISIASDLQEPPEIIIELLKKWEEGYKVVLSVKESSEENKILYYLRRLYYKILYKLSDDILINDATGFGLLDKKVVDILKLTKHRNTYYRGLITSIGFEIATVKYRQNKREKGYSKNNFLTLIQYASNGIVNHSSKLLRIISLICILISFYSIISLVYLLFLIIFKKNDQNESYILFYSFGAILFLSQSVFALYIESIHSYIKNKDMPLVIEKSRINFSCNNNKSK